MKWLLMMRMHLVLIERILLLEIGVFAGALESKTRLHLRTCEKTGAPPSSLLSRTGVKYAKSLSSRVGAWPDIHENTYYRRLESERIKGNYQIKN